MSDTQRLAGYGDLSQVNGPNFRLPTIQPMGRVSAKRRPLLH